MNCDQNNNSGNLLLKSPYNPDIEIEPEGTEIVHQIIKFIALDFPEVKRNLDDDMPEVELVKIFNENIEKIQTVEQTRSLKASRDLVRFIIRRCQNKCIKDPKSLLKYKPFSNQTYGELLFDGICTIIDNVKPKKDDIFLDVGSGIGQVVLVWAALTDCHLAIGIEMDPIRSTYAQDMLTHFAKMMSFFGKHHCVVQLEQVDFKEKNALIQNSPPIVVLANLMSIETELESSLSSLKIGSKVILRDRLARRSDAIRTKKNQNHLAALTSSLPTTVKCEVSWSGKIQPFYIYTIDKEKVPEEPGEPERNAKKKRKI